MHGPLPPKKIFSALLLLALWPCPAQADQFALKSTETGHLDYVFVGNAMSDNQGLSNGTNCLLPSNSVTILPSMLTARPRLISATLYISGSLIDDGVDYPPNTKLFDNPTGLTYDVAASQAQLTQEARASAAVAVDFQAPGAASPVTVSTSANAAYMSLYYVSAGVETGDVGFFTTPIDVTEAIRTAGGNLAGTFTVNNLVADVCRGVESVCDANLTQKCANIHTNGNASFALLLVYEDLALPLRSVSIFEGLTAFSSSVMPVQLINGNVVSDPASGSLTFYTLEGDLSIGRADPSETCGGDEYVQVSAAGKNLCLTDPDNPVGNIFNGSINTIPPPHPNPPGCTGTHACGLAGVDIDRFDISAALSPGVTEIDIAVGTGSDRIALAGVVLGVDVYQPILDLDSKFRLLNSLSSTALQLGGDDTVSLAISNTGNVAANNVQLAMPIAAGLENFEVLITPPGARVVHTNNSLQVTGFSVDPGKISEVRFRFTTACSMLNQTLGLTADVSAAQVQEFSVQAAPLTIGGPGLESCVGADPGGPFASLNPARVLRGDGCAAQSPPALLTAASFLVLVLWRVLKRRRALPRLTLPMLLALFTSHTACSPHHKAPAGPPPQALKSTANLPGQPCAEALMAQVTAADGSSFCIDRFEASVTAGSLGNGIQSQDDTSLAPDGSTQAAAHQALHAAPATSVSWYQAAALCQNAGKRLCTIAEWERACRGIESTTYPYGDSSNDSICNGFFQYFTPNPAPTGSFKVCVSNFGTYDLSGNVEEWLATPVTRVPGTTELNDRAIHGGSYASNSDALACVGVEFHAPPNQAMPDRGFRCCKDLP